MVTKKPKARARPDALLGPSLAGDAGGAPAATPPARR